MDAPKEERADILAARWGPLERPAVTRTDWKNRASSTYAQAAAFTLKIVSGADNAEYSDEEIQKIVAQIRKYDDDTRHDSIMDSVAKGTFNLAAIIEKALTESDESQ